MEVSQSLITGSVLFNLVRTACQKSKTSSIIFNSFWNKCHGYANSSENKQWPLNKRINPEVSISMIPLFDIPNHRQPKKIDLSDFVSFGFNISEKAK